MSTAFSMLGFLGTHICQSTTSFGIIYVLEQHIPYLSDIAKLIYKVTGKAVNFQWNKEQEEAFQQLKHYIHLSQLQNIQPGDKVVLDTAFISEQGNWGLHKKGKMTIS